MREVVAVIPVKRLARAKSRLASVLGPDERAVLVECMLHDVISTLLATQEVSAVIVATADEVVTRLARHLGAWTLHDRWETGVGEIVKQAAAFLKTEARTMLTVPVDVPLITPGDVAFLLDRHAQRKGVSIVPAARDGGTNALVTTSPDVIPFHYGHDSAARHYEAALEQGVAAQFTSLPSFEIDMDLPMDLRMVCEEASDGHTSQFLKHICIQDRVAPSTARPNLAEPSLAVASA